MSAPFFPSPLHHIGLMDVLATVQLLGIAPKEICLIGMQPQTIALGLDMNGMIQEKLDLLVARVIKQLESYRVACQRRD